MNSSFLILFVNYGPRKFLTSIWFQIKIVSTIGNQVFARAITLKTVEVATSDSCTNCYCVKQIDP